MDAIHYPNYFYLEGALGDSVQSHAAALRYVDGELGRLFTEWKKLRGQYICDLLFGSWHLLWGRMAASFTVSTIQLSIPFPISISLFDAMTKQQGVSSSSYMKKIKIRKGSIYEAVYSIYV